MTTTGEVAGKGERGVPEGPWWWAGRRSMWFDVVLAAASAGECAVEGVFFADGAGIPAVLGAVLGLVAGSTLLLRRRWAIAVVLVSVAVAPAEMGFLLGIVSLYTLAATDTPRRIVAALAGASVTATLVMTFVGFQRDMRHDGYAPPLWVVGLVAVLMSLGLTAPPVLFGLYVGARRRLVDSLRERADGLQRELVLLADRAEERAEWARNEERTRIAREMHDVVAHRVSLMVVHAAALQAVAAKDPGRASRNAGLIGDLGREALTELREMLGVLRSADRPAMTVPPVPLPAQAEAAEAAAPDASGTAGAEPPSLADVEALVAESRAAGMTVELAVEGERSRYAPGVEQAAYRVVQEALTNVHKHASGASTQVRLACRDDELAVLVVNGPGALGSSDVRLPSGGNGLVGMRERVKALHGGFVAGPTDAGGFRVSALLPDRIRLQVP
ncbi:sensor histidine kinase [Streptomyces meridianus]|uniref:histidine kinase n=1 Tax=Streptomyces meridianus TaxID=2938945 RepID=A0ABT0X9W4_9ACTN|nr:histidine kinase [Streptomyces meridianus]MCM2579140.1 histidine kinase [Streptomyces meridianus]